MVAADSGDIETIMSKVAFVTCREHPRLTTDDSLMFRPLAQYGIKLWAAAWDDPTVRWTDFALVVLRSTWDYHLRLNEFMSWLGRIEGEGVAIWNPPNLIRWNSHKSYLLELGERGISIVPTHILQPGTPVNLAELLAEKGWGEAIIKPSVGASSYRFWRVTQAQAEGQQGRLEKALASGAVLVQPFVQEISTEGEWSLTFFRDWGGMVTFSHAVIRKPAKNDLRVQSEYGGTVTRLSPPVDLLRQAERVLESIRGDWLYARVDGVLVGDEFWLMELELIEPELYLAYASEAPARFASAIRSVMR
jgi:glutathione synthase/RimK-type ligase-like ATP-grasp enzyme